MSVSSIFIVGLIALTSFQEGLAGRCGSNFTDAAGSFKSPGFPVKYDKDLDCDWFISPNKTSVFYIRSLLFHTLARVDTVTVSVRTSAGVVQLLEISGNTPLSVAFMIDRGDVVIVHFHTFYFETYPGFRLEYTTPDHWPEGLFKCNDGLMCVRSELACDGVNNCLDGSDEWGPMCPEHGPCGGNLTSDEGNLTSPGWPLQSGRGLSCDWFLSFNVTSSVFLRSLVFNIGVNAELAVSVLKANTSTEEAMIVTHLNEAVHDIVHVERGDVLHFRFTTNSTISQGFQLYYNAKDTCPDESMYYQCPDGACMPASFKCDGVNDCLDNSDELPSTCTDGCSNESLYHCANGQCVVGNPCDGIVECDDQSDESQGCLVSEGIVVGDSLQATVGFQPSQLEIRVSLCSDDLCGAIILYGLSPDRQSLAFESYGQCSNRSCDDNSLENYNYPSGWRAFAAGAWQFYVTIREESLSVGWNNASSDDAILPLTSVSGKRLLISPQASITWINQTTEDPSSLSTESTTDAPHSSSVTSEAPNPTAITSSTTSASSIAPANTSTTYSLAPVTTTMTSAASTRTPATTAPTTAFPTAMSTTAPTSTPNSPAPTSTVTTTTFAPTYTSTGRFTVTTPQPATTTTTPASTSGWTTITTGTSRPTVRPTVISTSTTQASSTPYATTSDQTPTWTTTEQSPTSSSTTPTDPDFPTSSTPTPTPSATWPPVPPPPDCPTDFPLRYQYLLIPVESHPQLYVICFAGWGQSMKCPQPLIFSYKQQKCIWSWN